MSSEMERRKRPRFRTQFHAGFVTEQLAGEGIVLNLSTEGCLVESDTSPKEGEYLIFRISLPDEDPPVEIESAAVRWVVDRAFGLEFLFMKQEAHDRLERFMETLKKNQGTGCARPWAGCRRRICRASSLGGDRSCTRWLGARGIDARWRPPPPASALQAEQCRP